ncbi:MAG: DUF2730 family protein [Rhizobiaceae bacterium]|nr:DUF2730 family protein [Rhizobiaceae bacterium]
MDLAPLVPWVSFAALLISVGASLYTMLTSGAKANQTKLTDHDRRIQHLENELKHLPDRDQTHRLEIGLEKLTGQMAMFDERLKPIAAISTRLQEFLIEQGGKGK